MKAKCPYCESGCDACKEGFIEIGIASGFVFTPTCRDCKQQTLGMHISDSATPPPEEFNKYAVCVNCFSHNLEWKLEAYSDGKDTA